MSLVSRTLPGNLAATELSDLNVQGGTSPVLGHSGATTIVSVFLDNTAEHQQYLTHDGLTLIGQCLAEGCMAWGN